MEISSALTIWLSANTLIALTVIFFIVPPTLHYLHTLTTLLYLPKGPFPLPSVGNLHLFRSRSRSRSARPIPPWISFASLVPKYGGIYTFFMGSSPRLILSSPNIASTLLSTRGAKYSSRPPLIVFNMYCPDASLIAQTYTPLYRYKRKLLERAVSGSSLPILKPRQEAEASILLSQLLLSSPASKSGQDRKCDYNWSQALDRFGASIVFSIAYGRHISSPSSKIIASRNRFISYGGSLVVPGRYLAESFPILRHLPTFLPFMSWKASILSTGALNAAWDARLVSMTKTDLSHGIKAGSLIETMLEQRAKSAPGIELLNERNFNASAATTFLVGSDTTSATLHYLILALLTHPHILLLLQQEIDSVIGTARSPTFADIPSLPYIEAVIKEMSRWRPVVPLGLPHHTTVKDTYEGKTIPAGTTVLANVWAMHMDESYFPRASLFLPERWLAPDHPLHNPSLVPKKEFPNKYGSAAFGWGRRICPGAELAMQSLGIAVAKIFWGFNLFGVEGEKYNIAADHVIAGTIVRPESFKAVFEVRSEGHRLIIEQERVLAESVLSAFVECGE